MKTLITNSLTPEITQLNVISVRQLVAQRDIHISMLSEQRSWQTDSASRTFVFKLLVRLKPNAVRVLWTLDCLETNNNKEETPM